MSFFGMEYEHPALIEFVQAESFSRSTSGRVYGAVFAGGSWRFRVKLQTIGMGTQTDVDAILSAHFTRFKNLAFDIRCPQIQGTRENDYPSGNIVFNGSIGSSVVSSS